jgi:hypothetical protein
VRGVRGEIATAIDRTAVLDTDRTVCAHTLATATLDRDETAFANRAARAAVGQVGLQIDAGARLLAVGQSGSTSDVALGREASPGLTADEHRGGQQTNDLATRA